MHLFGKTEKMVLTSNTQRDAFIEKLQNAHVRYRVFEVGDSIYDRKKYYIIRFSEAGLRKAG